MHFYKDYQQKIRKRALSVMNIIIGGDISPKLHNYLLLLDNLLETKKDNFAEYYGEVKKIVNSFIIDWTEVMNNAIKEADKVTKVVNKSELVEYVNNTIEMQQMKQSNFEKIFLPITTPEEKEAYDEILVHYGKYIDTLENIKVSVTAMRDYEAIKKFAQVNFALSLHKKNDTFAFTHTYIAEMLANNIKCFDTSLHKLVSRTRKNLRELQERYDKELGGLHNELYNKNKEHLALSRKPFRSSSEIAEVQRNMDKLKHRIENYKHNVLSQVKDEFNYWNEKLSKFKRIAKTINDLNKIKEKVLEQQNIFLELRNAEIPKNKVKCWEHLEGVFAKKLASIDEKKKEAARALLSFFCVRGPDHIFYNDSVGRYYVDQYGHKVYVYDYGLKMYHVNCAGEFVEGWQCTRNSSDVVCVQERRDHLTSGEPSARLPIFPNILIKKEKSTSMTAYHEAVDFWLTPDTEVYYYDYNGRYVLDTNGEKVYKIAPCTSSYRLVNDSLIKSTVDCGHSERPNESCKMGMKDCHDDVLIPDVAAVDIKGKLDKDTGFYLWDCFGHVLPEVLYEVAREHPKNPIHCLAHKLLRFKYDRTLKELQQKRDEAARYRSEIYQNRKDKAAAAKRVWRAKQVQRGNSSDDMEEQAMFGHHIARQEFINSLINFYG